MDIFETFYEYDDLYRLMEAEFVELYRAKRYVVEKLERPSNLKDGGKYREILLEIENSEELIEALLLMMMKKRKTLS